MTPRVSTTTIDQFALFRSGDWMAEADLMASIRGEFHPNRKMLCGMAFHAIIEDPAAARCKDGWYANNNIRFPPEIIEAALTHYDPAGVAEVKATKLYVVNGQEVEVVAKVDQLRGLGIVETKTRWATFDADKYADSCQWRYYIDVFGAASVRYVVFQLDENAAGEFSLRDVHEFSCYPYPELHGDCTRLLGEFMHYVKSRNLERFLVARSAA